jgi:hypothetical protein
VRVLAWRMRGGNLSALTPRSCLCATSRCHPKTSSTSRGSVSAHLRWEDGHSYRLMPYRLLSRTSNATFRIALTPSCECCGQLCACRRSMSGPSVATSACPRSAIPISPGRPRMVASVSACAASSRASSQWIHAANLAGVPENRAVEGIRGPGAACAPRVVDAKLPRRRRRALFERTTGCAEDTIAAALTGARPVLRRRTRCAECSATRARAPPTRPRCAAACARAARRAASPS